MRKSIKIAALTLLLAGCGGHSGGGSSDTPATPPTGQSGPLDMVVKAQATLVVSTSSVGSLLDAMQIRAGEQQGTLPVSVVLAPNSSMTLDTSKFSVPTV